MSSGLSTYYLSFIAIEFLQFTNLLDFFTDTNIFVISVHTWWTTISTKSSGQSMDIDKELGPKTQKTKKTKNQEPKIQIPNQS